MIKTQGAGSAAYGRPVKKRKRKHVGLFLLLLLMTLIAFLFYDSNTRLTTHEYPLYFDNLPSAFDGYRIVQLSDLHAAVFGKENMGFIDAVKKTRPDIIVITGDIINNDNASGDDMGIATPLVRALVDIAPVYYVTGNHEWDSGRVRELLKMLGDSGVTALRNDYARLTIGAASIVLAGVDDPNGPEDMKTPEQLVSDIRNREGAPFIVLLAHRNNYMDRFSRLGLDLVLCGHAHGGMIRLPFLGGLVGPTMEFFPEYTAGVYRSGGTTMLVSRGVGNYTGLPRFLNNPEIPVVILKKS
jgi:predicted MPP superfamily phosphohydrolase